VNDNAETLISLSEQLYAAGVLPYYLHALDKVQGAAHFDMTMEKARHVHKTMQETLPGYLVPKLVFEEPGEMHKILIM
jgi:L-lysine 2,3-aminomutase